MKVKIFLCKEMTIGIALFVTLCWLDAFHDPVGAAQVDKSAAPNNATVSELASQYKTLEQRYHEYLCHPQMNTKTSYDSWNSDIRPLDDLVRRLLAAHFAEKMSFVKTVNELSNALNFVEVPQSLTINLRSTGGETTDILNPEGKSRKALDSRYPTVLYGRVESKSATVIVMQNLFLVYGRTEPLRLRSTPYALVMANGKLDTGVVDEELMSGAPDVSSPVTVVDIIEIGAEAPWIAVVNGPRGNGNYVDLILYSYDFGKGQWLRQNVGKEWDSTSSWHYERNAKTLSVSGDTVRLDTMIMEYLEQIHVSEAPA